jgi:exodeoxyribonuclease VII large subunit
MVVPVRRDLLDRVDDLGRRLNGATGRAFDLRRTRLAAAARALPRPAEMLALPRQRFDAAAAALVQALRHNTSAHQRRFDRLAARLTPASLEQGRRLLTERVAGLAGRADRAIGESLTRRAAMLARVSQVFEAVSHKATLRRGYALVFDASGHPLNAAAGIADGTRLDIEFHDGRVHAVTGDQPAPAASPAAPPHKSRRGPGSAGGDQGSLF